MAKLDDCLIEKTTILLMFSTNNSHPCPFFTEHKQLNLLIKQTT